MREEQYDVVLAHSDRPFSDTAIEGIRLSDLFPSQPLPIGIEHAIPSATDGTAERGHMDDRPGGVSSDAMRSNAAALDAVTPATVTLDAVDPGHTGLGRTSPQIAYYLRQSRSPRTHTLYRWAWARALRACAAMNRCALPMDEATAAMVIVDAVNDGLVFGSVKVVASVISVAHQIARQPDPTTGEAFCSVLRGIARVIGKQQNQKVALDLDELRLIYETCLADPNRAVGIRDWAVVSFGFAGCFRRSEIVARNHDDLEWDENRLRVYIDRSKTDQYGRGTYVEIKPAKDPRLCPLRALRAWIDIAPGPGPLFRSCSKHNTVNYHRLSAGAVTDIVKRFGIVLDLPDERLGAHSLRAGMVTALIENGAPDTVTMEHSRHASIDTLRRYYRPRRSTLNYTEMAGL